MQPKCPDCDRIYKSYFTLHKHESFCPKRNSTPTTTTITTTTESSPESNHSSSSSALNTNRPLASKSTLKNADKNSVNDF